MVDAAGDVIDLTAASSVKFIMKSSDTGVVAVNAAATIVTAASGAVRYDWADGDTDLEGTYEAEFQALFVVSSEDVHQTSPVSDFITVTIYRDLAD